MLANIFYIVLAIFGVGFLILIHELGHYFMAKRVKMQVKTFSIGFGKAIYSWKRGEVTWKIGMIPFGGYVMPADKKFGKSDTKAYSEVRPIDRIKVAFAGPLVNLVFAFIAFTMIWLMGGREKFFHEFTHRIGWMDSSSELFQKGVRPGDEVITYDGKNFAGFKDLLYSAVLKQSLLQITGLKINYFDNTNSSFDYTLKPYENSSYSMKGLSTIGVLFPAKYLIYEKLMNSPDGDIFSSFSPMNNSGIKEHDRIIWADGEIIFSNEQLNALTNQSIALATIKRGDNIFITKIPRVQLQEFVLSAYDKDEIDDWKHDTNIPGKLKDLYFIPYYFNENAVIENRLTLLDDDDEAKVFNFNGRSDFYTPLERNDRIIAINGERVDSSYDVLKSLQKRHMVMVVQRNKDMFNKKITWKQGDLDFASLLDVDALKKVVYSIGTDQPIVEASDMHLLKPITPVSLYTILSSSEKGKQLLEKISEQQPLDDLQNRLVLGAYLRDKAVVYNPSPLVMFGSACVDAQRTFTSLVTGSLHPKWISSPIGIVQVIQHSFMIGFREALFWLAIISLNLGIINLLPIPVLDGGHILFSGIEMITRKPLKDKLKERIIIPFLVLLIGLFIFVTYHDIIRIFSNLIK